MAQPIRIGLLGGGHFIRARHIPTLLKLSDRFEIAAVYSRSQASTDAVNEALPEPVPAYHDVDELLARDDIDAVDIVLPIHVTPDFIQKALLAGKHVMSEKPVAPTVAEGKTLIKFYDDHRNLVWKIAENWRYLPALNHAMGWLESGKIGKPILAHFVSHVDMSPSNPYYQSPWRRDGSFPGGFLLDVGVHHVSLFRMLLGEITAVNALTMQMKEDLPPADTMSVALQFERGLLASYGVTFAGASSESTMITVVGENGAIRFDRKKAELIAGDEHETIAINDDVNGMEGEFIAFADAIQNGKPHLNTPETCLQDVVVVEAILNSAGNPQAITSVL